MKLFTRTLGDGSRTAGLVHGASESSTAWNDFAELLIERYDFRLIVVDQRGHGRSDRADSYAVEEFAADLVESLPQKLDVLIGQSLGGLTAAVATPALRPKRFIGIDPAFALSSAYAAQMRVTSAIQPYLPRVLIRAMGVARTGAATIDRQMANWDAWDRRMIPELVRAGTQVPFPPQLPVVPSTIVLAERSVVISGQRAEEFRAAGWDVRVLPKSPHDMHIQMPRELADLLDDQLAS